MQAKFLSIEGLRAWMAWWVVIVHSYDIIGRGLVPEKLEKMLTRSDAAVSVFIIVSGFVITHLLVKSSVSYGPFLARRFFRLFPIYITCLLLQILMREVWPVELAHLAWPPGSEAIRADRMAVVADTYWLRFGLHLTMLQGLVPEEVLKYITSSFLTPTWSLSLEWQFYLVAPLLIGLLRHSLWSFVLVSAAVLAGGAIARAGYLGTYAMPSMLLLSIQFFLIGIASRLYLELPHRLGVNATVFLLLGLGAVLVLHSVVATIWFVFFTFILVENDRLKPTRFVHAVMHAIATNRVIGYLGRISFSTYLIHYPLFTLSILLWPGAAQASKNEMLLHLWAVLPVVIVVSAGLYQWVEKPFIKFGARFAEPRPAALASHGPQAALPASPP